MKIFDLGCDNGHRFEGWFGSGDDYERQKREDLLSCPVCASAHVERLPSAPYIGKSQPKPAPVAQQADALPVSPSPSAQSQSVANLTPAMFAKVVEHLVRNTEDVGGRFPEEARRIHYGESAERRIRGTASPEEVQSLGEEGIEVLALPGHLAARRH
jgi:hypothetical protein